MMMMMMMMIRMCLMMMIDDRMSKRIFLGEECDARVERDVLMERSKRSVFFSIVSITCY